MFQQSIHLIHSAARDLADLLLPPSCFSCGGEISGHHEMCGQCWQVLNFVTKPYCEVCGFPFEHETASTSSLCAGCLRRTPNFDVARAALCYDGASRRLVLGLKYGDRTEGTRTFAHWLARSAGAAINGADAVIPVPLHPFRLFRRRYNQAGIMARALARELNCRFDTRSLYRKKPTPSQGGLTRRQRFKNVRSAFDVRKTRREAISGFHVVLVDDVMTTGATVETCARVLKRAGAARVSVLTLTRVGEPTPEPV
jgi:ComF family protein